MKVFVRLHTITFIPGKRISRLAFLLLSVIYYPSFSQQPADRIKYLKKDFNLPLPGKSDLALYKNIFKPGVTLNSFWTEAGFVLSNGLFSTDSLTADHLQQYDVRSFMGLGIAGIPLLAEFTYRKSSPSYFDESLTKWYKISFDVEKYKQQWRKIAEKISPEGLTEAGKQYKELGNAFKEQLVSRYKTKWESKIKNQLDSITGNINATALLNKTPEELSALFFGQDIKRLLVTAREKLLELEGLTMLKEKKDSLSDEWKTKIRELEAKDEYIKELVNLVKVAQSSGMIDSMKALYNNAEDEYRKLLDNPYELGKRLAAKYQLGGIEKLFTLLSQLKLGGQPVPFAEQSLVPLLSRGFSFEINIKDKFIGFSIGKIIPVTSDLRFTGTDSLLNNKTSDKPSYWHLNYRKGLLTENHKGIKLTSVKNAGSSTNQLQSADFIEKNTLLINLYSRENLFGNNWLTAEISKSVSISPNQFILDNSQGISDRKTNFFDLNNLSIKLKTEGTLDKIGLAHQAYFNKIIGVYANITTNYPATSGYETGFSLRMKQKGKKISSYLKGQLRNYNIPGFTGSRWKSSDLRLRLTYKLKKGQYAQLGMHSHDGYKSLILSSALKIIRQQSQGITADLSLVNKRIFGLFNTSYISAKLQKDHFPVTGFPGKDKIISNSASLLLNQTFLYKEHLLTMNIDYTHVSQDIDVFLYNSRLDADMGGTFKMNKNISAGFSMVYGYLKGAYSNAGIRASLSGVLFKNIELNINSDIRKNITLSNPLFREFINLSCGVKYILKN